MVKPPSFAIDTEIQEGSARLLVTGELDIATVELLEREVESVLGQNITQLVIDLSPLTFIDSSALRLFVVLNDRAVAAEWKLSLIRPLGPALTIFQISGAEESLPFIDEEPA